MLTDADARIAHSNLQQIEELDFATLSEAEIGEIQLVLRQLLGYSAIYVHTAPLRELYRITVNKQVLGTSHNQRLAHASQVRYPPPGKTGFNRANLPGSSVLYASFSKLIPLLELKPPKGTLVTVSRWRLRPRTAIKVAVVLQDEAITRAMPYFRPHLERLHEELKSLPAIEAGLVRRTASFVAKQFTKVVAASRKIDYLVSASLSDLLLNHRGIEAIVYPSVPAALLDVNIAIRPDVVDEKLELVALSEEIVCSDFQQDSHFHSSRTARAERFDGGVISWGPDSVPAADIPTLHTQI